VSVSTQVNGNDHTLTITNPATAFTLTPLTDLVPTGPEPPLLLIRSPAPAGLTVRWPDEDSIRPTLRVVLPSMPRDS
jgi:hypothetical protein